MYVRISLGLKLKLSSLLAFPPSRFFCFSYTFLISPQELNMQIKYTCCYYGYEHTLVIFPKILE